jgi:hypothetical protein
LIKWNAILCFGEGAVVAMLNPIKLAKVAGFGLWGWEKGGA